MKGGRRIGLLLTVLVLAAALVGAIVVRAIQASEPAEPELTVDELRAERGAPVVLAPARAGELEAWRSFHGTVSGAREGVVRARTDNTISRVFVEVGDEVRENEPLVQFTGEGIQAQHRQAQTSFQHAERQKQRLEALHEEGAITDQEWEEAVTQYEIARDDLASAREALRLQSPLTGTVTEVPARAGMVPSPGDPLVRVADLSALTITLRVGASAARQIETGQPARAVEADARGRVSRVALQADPQTRLVEVELSFSTDAPLVPGTLEEVEVRTDARADVLRVPPAAVDDDHVWVVGEDDRARRKEVTTGLETPDAVEIEEGLAEGERVVIQGTAALEDGMPVRVVDIVNEAV